MERPAIITGRPQKPSLGCAVPRPTFIAAPIHREDNSRDRRMKLHSPRSAARNPQCEFELARERTEAVANWLQTVWPYQEWRERVIQRLNEFWDSSTEHRWERVRQLFHSSVTLCLTELGFDSAWEDWIAAEVASALPEPIQNCLHVLGGPWERESSSRRGLNLPRT
jgi:hypothetical protein